MLFFEDEEIAVGAAAWQSFHDPIVLADPDLAAPSGSTGTTDGTMPKDPAVVTENTNKVRHTA